MEDNWEELDSKEELVCSEELLDSIVDSGWEEAMEELDSEDSVSAKTGVTKQKNKAKTRQHAKHLFIISSPPLIHHNTIPVRRKCQFIIHFYNVFVIKTIFLLIFIIQYFFIFSIDGLKQT